MKLEEVGNTIKVSGEIECRSCKGTGVYVGFAEHDGAAVVCHSCDGSGKINFSQTFTKFSGKKIKKGVKRVYDGSHGYVITAKDIICEGKNFPFSEVGVDYESWFNEGKEPLPLKFLICPYLHTNQSLQSEDKNNLYKYRCNNKLSFGSITNCKCFKDKETCWKIYDGEVKIEEGEKQ